MEQSHYSDQLHTPSNHSRRPISPARQSSRRPLSTAEGINSLLSHLSPSYVLEALLATSPSLNPVSQAANYSVRDPQTFVNAAAAQASSSERIWGIKAARFAKKVLEWQEELAAWVWPQDEHKNGFLARYQDPRVQDYQRRVENIQDELRRLEVNELKDYVREAHSRSGLGVSPGANQYEVLDDFTALITATIVQALPRLAQLNALLGTWFTRFAILRRVSVFLQDISACNESMLAANLAIQTPSSPSIRSTTRFSQRIFQDTKAALEDQVTSLAQRLDMMLDLLEGSQDTLPDTWIDDMDRLENEYGSWVVQAQQVVLNNELDAQHTRTRIDFTRDEFSGSYEDPLTLQEHTIHRKPSSNNFDRTRADFVSPASDMTSFQGSQDLSLGMKQDALQSKIAEQSHQLDRSDKTFSSDDNSVDLESLKDVSASATTESSSNVSSPLISHAEVATNLGSPVMVHSPVKSHPSMGFPLVPKTPPSLPISEARQRRSWHGLPMLEGSQPQQRRRSSTVTDKFGSPQYDYTPNGNVETTSKSPSTRPRSASVQSFELVQRKEVRTIQIKRSQTAPLLGVLPSSDDLRLKNMMQKAPGRNPETNSLNSSKMSPKASSPVLREDPRKAMGILGALTMEAAFSDEVESDQKPLVTHSSLPQRDVVPNKAAVLQNSPSKARAAHLQPAPTNRLDQQINSILSNIPADIRLMSAPDPASKRMQTSLNVPKISAPRRVSLPRIMRSKTSGQGVSATLAPATQTPSDSRTGGESDIRLYHLHQVGKETPIKLYVRLVGETSERVMVRVGGGWADLEEYLKEYASHHGKRSISEGKFSLQGMPSAASSFSSTLHPNPPTSATTATTTTTTTTAASRSTSPSPFSMGTRNVKLQSQTILPPASKSSPPQTPPSDLFGSTDGESPSPSMGLAGPRTRKIDISPRKQAWVEGMLRQARGAGASASDWGREKSKKYDGNSSNRTSSHGGGVGDLGKVGGVKRVFFRHRQESL